MCLVCLGSEAFGQLANSADSNLLGQPSAEQTKQINEILRSYSRIGFVGGLDSRAAVAVGPEIVPRLVDELVYRDDRITYDPLTGEDFDANDRALANISRALETFARRDSRVVNYLVFRMNNQNEFRRIKLIEILESVAIDGLSDSAGPDDTIVSALSRASQSRDASVAVAAAQALASIDDAWARFERVPDAESVLPTLDPGNRAVGLLESAAVAASRIADVRARDRVYNDLAVELLAHDEPNAALAIADRITEQFPRRDTQHSIALYFAEIGDIAGATSLFKTEMVLTPLALTLSRRGREAEIEPALGNLENSSTRASVYRKLAKDQLTRSDVAAALDSIRRIEFAHSRIADLTSLIGLASEIGNRRAAEEIAQKTLSEARRTRRGSTRASALLSLATASREADVTGIGDTAFFESLDAMQAETGAQNRTFSAVRIAYEANARGQFDLAARLANQIESSLSSYRNPSLEAGYRAAVAVIRIQSGRSVEEERQMAMTLSSGISLAEHLIRLASWDAAQGDLDAALNVVERIRHISSFQATKAIDEIVTVRLRTGDFDGAIAFASRWDSPSRQQMEVLIASAIESSKFDLAADLGHRFSKYARDIAEALLDAGDLEAAFRAASAIPSRPGPVRIRLPGQEKTVTTEWGDARGEAYSAIAIAALARGQRDLANSVLKEVQYPLTRALVLCDLAAAESELGNDDAATDRTEQAIALLPDIALEGSRNRALAGIVQRHVADSRYREAADIERSAAVPLITRTYVVALANAGRHDEVLQIVQAIDDPKDRADALISLAAPFSELESL